MTVIIDPGYLEELEILSSCETISRPANYHTFVKRSRDETLNAHPNYIALVAQTAPPDPEEGIATTEMVAMVWNEKPDDEQ